MRFGFLFCSFSLFHVTRERIEAVLGSLLRTYWKILLIFLVFVTFVIWSLHVNSDIS